LHLRRWNRHDAERLTPAGEALDRNGKKPKATHNEPPHPERSDSKSHHREEVEEVAAKTRDEADRKSNERLALKNATEKGPQHL
jgi:hypothetical protein